MAARMLGEWFLRPLPPPQVLVAFPGTLDSERRPPGHGLLLGVVEELVEALVPELEAQLVRRLEDQHLDPSVLRAPLVGSVVGHGILLAVSGRRDPLLRDPVLDERGDFEQRCNLAMVELEPIPAEDEALEHLEHQGGDLETHGRVDIRHDMTRYDAARLQQLIQQHVHYTDSSRGRQILDNWNDYLPKFVKVMPVDYRRALQEMQQAKQDTSPRDGAPGGH